MMAAACQSSSDKSGTKAATTAACDTVLLSQYDLAKDGHTNPLLLGKAIRSFYALVPEDCRPVVATGITKDLFDLVYRNHETDTLVLPFLMQLAQDKKLREAQRGRALLSIAGYYLYGATQTDSAGVYLKMAEHKWPEMDDTVRKYYHSLMGQYMLSRAKMKEASDHYLKAIELCEQLKDSTGLAGNYANYGTVFSKMGEYLKSIEMKQKAVAFFAAQKQYDKLLIGYVGIGVEYGFLRQYDSSMAYYQKAVALTEQGIRNPSVEFDLYISMGGISLGRNQYELARYYYSKVGELIDLSKNEGRRKVYIMASTPAFAVIRNVDKEIAEIQSYIPGYYEQQNLNDVRDAYYTLFHIYYLQNNFEKALDNYQVYDSLKSVMAREENKQYVAEMETKYETQKKELQIKVQQKEIKQSRTLNGFLITLLTALGLGAAFVITRIKLGRKKKEAELQHQFTRQLLNNTEEERGRIAKDLHDGISQELLILKRQINTNQEHTNDRIDAIINEIRMISRDLHPVMLDKIGLKLSIEHICSQMMEHNLLFITAEIQYNNSLNSSSELQLFRMIQEALNNVLKYAEAEAAKVTIRESATFVHTEIIDNGKGFDVAASLSSKMSFGLLSLTERAKSLNGKTEISSSAAGTVVKIEIPKSHV
jgi:signal transduction histidine kinase